MGREGGFEQNDYGQLRVFVCVESGEGGGGGGNLVRVFLIHPIRPPHEYTKLSVINDAAEGRGRIDYVRLPGGGGCKNTLLSRWFLNSLRGN